jgi:hypothetical protein
MLKANRLTLLGDQASICFAQPGLAGQEQRAQLSGTVMGIPDLSDFSLKHIFLYRFAS